MRSIGRPPGADPLIPPGAAGNHIPLNVDVVPQVFPDGRIQVRINIEYRPNSTNPNITVSSLIAEFRPILEDGTKLVISQASDPTSDRRISVEVIATVLK